MSEHEDRVQQGRLDMKPHTRKTLWPLAGCVVVLLSGCTLNPAALMPRGSATGPAVPPPATGETAIPDDPFGGIDATAAERACMAAGQERGLEVLGVVGARDVTATNGDQTRDVMLRVRRGSTEIEVRCNYAAATGMARIMLI